MMYGWPGLLRPLPQLCDELPGYADQGWAAGRREASAKLLASLVQRDADVRLSLISQGCLKRALQLLRAQVGTAEGLLYCAVLG
jgi:hypothetical protein